MNGQKSEKITVLQPMVLSKKWLQNHPKFLLHFLIHINVLMLCRKFEAIPTSIFRLTAINNNNNKGTRNQLKLATEHNYINMYRKM